MPNKALYRMFQNYRSDGCTFSTKFYLNNLAMLTEQPNFCIMHKDVLKPRHAINNWFYERLLVVSWVEGDPVPLWQVLGRLVCGEQFLEYLK